MKYFVESEEEEEETSNQELIAAIFVREGLQFSASQHVGGNVGTELPNVHERIFQNPLSCSRSRDDQLLTTIMKKLTLQLKAVSSAEMSVRYGSEAAGKGS